MKFIIVGFCVFIYFCNVCFIQGKTTWNDDMDEDLEEYYWRHYTDHVPRDALPGGRDILGQTTYIGQTLFRGVLIPGQFIIGERKLYFEWGDAERSTDSNIKILCTKHPEQFEWIRTNTTAVGRIPNKNFVLGGFESDYTVYIGRVAIEDTLAIGKVIFTTYKSSSQGFHTTCRANASFVRAQEFEVLNFEPTIPSVEKIKQAVDKKFKDPNSADKLRGGLLTSFLVTLLLLR